MVDYPASHVRFQVDYPCQSCGFFLAPSHPCAFALAAGGLTFSGLGNPQENHLEVTSFCREILLEPPGAISAAISPGFPCSSCWLKSSRSAAWSLVDVTSIMAMVVFHKFLIRDTVDGRNPANQMRLVVDPIIYRGFSTIQVVQDFVHQQYQGPQKMGFVDTSYWSPTKQCYCHLPIDQMKTRQLFLETNQRTTKSLLLSLLLESLGFGLSSEKSQRQHARDVSASPWSDPSTVSVLRTILIAPGNPNSANHQRQLSIKYLWLTAVISWATHVEYSSFLRSSCKNASHQ